MIYPCESVISVFHFRPVDIAEGWWTPLLTDIFIQCCSQIYLFRVAHGCIHSVLPLCPQPSAWTLIKKRNTDITDLTQIGLSRISFFWYYLGQWCLDLGLIYLDLRVQRHSLFPVRLVLWFQTKNLDKPLYAFASLTAWFLPHRSPLREPALDSQPARQESVATTVTNSQKHTSDKPR